MCFLTRQTEKKLKNKNKNKQKENTKEYTTVKLQRFIDIMQASDII